MWQAAFLYPARLICHPAACVKTPFSVWAFSARAFPISHSLYKLPEIRNDCKHAVQTNASASTRRAREAQGDGRREISHPSWKLRWRQRTCLRACCRRLLVWWFQPICYNSPRVYTHGTHYMSRWQLWALFWGINLVSRRLAELMSVERNYFELAAINLSIQLNFFLMWNDKIMKFIAKLFSSKKGKAVKHSDFSKTQA